MGTMLLPLMIVSWCGMKEIKPLEGIPQIKLLDKDGREFLRGWYVFHETRQLCSFNDYLKEEDVKQYLVYDGFADFNLPRGMVRREIKPTDTIEIIEPTCFNIWGTGYSYFVCSECGYEIPQEWHTGESGSGLLLNYCPSCGRKVSDE